MARPKRREPLRRNESSSRASHSATEEPARKLPPPRPPRPNKWFLMVTALLLALWTGFLVVMAVWG